MKFDKIKNLKFYLFLFFLLFVILFYYFFISQLQKEKNLVIKPISINLLTSVHPDLLWSFKPVKKKL